jgi:hypothetical protein
MLGNDSVGDCTIAGVAHLIQLMTGNASPPGFVPNEADVLAAYSALSGYNPADPSTDTGLDLLTVLNYWRQTGFFGHKIVAFTSVNHLDQAEVCAALDLFGGLYAGVALPLSAQSEVGSVWNLSSDATAGAPNSWGGHCAPTGTYSPAGPDCITWGQWKQQMTWAFQQAYFDELYAVVTPDWIAANGNAPSGFDLAQLQSDLSEIT